MDLESFRFIRLLSFLVSCNDVVTELALVIFEFAIPELLFAFKLILVLLLLLILLLFIFVELMLFELFGCTGVLANGVRWPLKNLFAG
jgi:hypothetical protein